MSNPLHPEDGIVISKKWLEGKIKRVSECKYAHAFDAYHRVLENSHPLKPLLEVAFNAGYEADSFEIFINNQIDIKY